jgi:Tol biopolymer transport system component
LGTAGALPTPAAATRIAAPTISPDGHYVGYSFNASNIVGGVPAGVTEAYAYDTTTGATTLVSVGASGAGNGSSTPPVFSADHRYAVFQSDATNLVAGDTNGKSDVFVRDLVAGTTTRVSLGNDGSQANDSSTSPYISADGTRVMFTSLATNLVVGDTNGVADAFVRYLGTNETVRVSVGANSVQAGAGADPAAVVGGVGLSGDGKLALFTSGDALVAGDTNSKPDLWARTLG